MNLFHTWKEKNNVLISFQLNNVYKNLLDKFRKKESFKNYLRILKKSFLFILTISSTFKSRPDVHQVPVTDQLCVIRGPFVSSVAYFFLVLIKLHFQKLHSSRVQFNLRNTRICTEMVKLLTSLSKLIKKEAYIFFPFFRGHRRPSMAVLSSVRLGSKSQGFCSARMWVSSSMHFFDTRVRWGCS